MIHLNSNSRCCHVKTLLHEFNSTVALANGFMKGEKKDKLKGMKEKRNLGVLGIELLRDGGFLIHVCVACVTEQLDGMGFYDMSKTRNPI